MRRGKFHDAHGISQRQLRVGELIRRTLAEILVRGEIHDPELNRFSVTVGEVRASADLKVATAYVSPLGGREYESLLELLNRNKAELRQILGKRLELKFTPEVRFRIDETYDQMDETRRLFSQESVRRDIEC